MRLALREQPASMAALIGALADPGSNRNPVSLDGRMLLPREPDGMQPAGRRPGRGRVCAGGRRDPRRPRQRRSNCCCRTRAGRPWGTRAIVELLGAAAQTKFEPARAGGAPVAVNMVWLLAQTRGARQARRACRRHRRSSARVRSAAIGLTELPVTLPGAALHARRHRLAHRRRLAPRPAPSPRCSSRRTRAG